MAVWKDEKRKISSRDKIFEQRLKRRRMMQQFDEQKEIGAEKLIVKSPTFHPFKKILINGTLLEMCC